MTYKLNMTVCLDFEEIEAETRARFATQTGLGPDDIGSLKDATAEELANGFTQQAVQHFNDIKSSMDIDDFLRDNDIFGLVATWKVLGCRVNDTDDASGPSPLGDLRYVDFTATGLMDEEITCGANLGRTGFVFEIRDGEDFTMFTLANDDAIRLSDAIKPMKITPEMFGAATAAVLEASEAGEMFEDERYNIVKAVMKVFGLELDTPPKDGKAAA